MVAALHGVIFSQLGRWAPEGQVVLETAPVLVELWSPPRAPEPPPPPEHKPSPEAGGGRPSAPSRVHTPSQPPPKAPELPIAPPILAPEPELVVGPSPTPVPAPQATTGRGQSGSGQGTGAGDGRGAGSGTGPVFIRGTGPQRVRRAVPRDLRASIPARLLVDCEIGLDTRLRACRIASPDPNAQAIGAYAIPVVVDGFRFEPPTDSSGRPIEGRRVTVTLVF